MYLENDFKEEFIEKYSETEFDEVEKLLQEMWGYDTDKIDQTFTKWSLSLEKEKHHQLQYTYYIHLSKEGVDYDEEVNLEYENGINNGTVLREYSLDGSGGVPIYKEIEVLKDIEPDWDKIKMHFVEKGKIKIEDKMSDDWKYKISQVFKHHKHKIIEEIGKQSYDNYVTGGGTVKTDSYYNELRKEWGSKGFYYKTIYEIIEADVNLV